MPAGLPASLRRRVGAFALDYLVIAAWIGVVVGVGVLVRSVAPDLAATLFGDPLRSQLSGFLSLTLPVALYFMVSEASAAGGTLGKRRLGLRVVTADGRRIGRGRSALRTALKLLPWELAHTVIWRFAFPGSAPEVLLTGGLVVVWVLVFASIGSALLDGQHRALHDRLSGTLVVRT